jgi:hypothetical protein
MKTRAVKALVSTDSSSSNPLARVAQRFDPLTREVELLSRFSDPNRVYAYCFCRAE